MLSSFNINLSTPVHPNLHYPVWSYDHEDLTVCSLLRISSNPILSQKVVQDRQAHFRHLHSLDIDLKHPTLDRCRHIEQQIPPRSHPVLPGTTGSDWDCRTAPRASIHQAHSIRVQQPTSIVGFRKAASSYPRRRNIIPRGQSLKRSESTAKHLPSRWN